MNREILLEAAIAITVGLLVAILAAYRTHNAPKPGVLRRSGMTSLLVYAVIAAGVLVGQGMTLVGLLVLLLLLVLPVVANVRCAQPLEGAARLLAAAVGVGMVAAMLIAAGQTLALLGRVDPRTVVVVLVVIAALVVGGQGVAAAGRIGSTTMWILIVPIVLSLALGLFVGAPNQVAAPIIAVPGLDWWQVLGLAVAFLALGWADNGLSALRRAGGWTPWRVWAGAAVVVVLIAVGQLAFLGGAVISPSLQFFVFPANIDLVPGLAGVLLAITTVVFVALVVTPLAGVHEAGATRWLAIGAVVAAVVALVDPGLQTVVVVTGLLAAALLGAQLGGSVRRGVMAGVLMAGLVALGLFLLDDAGFGAWSAGGSVVVGLVAFAASRSAQDREAAPA